MKILVLNAGSSSHKLSLYALHNEDPIEPIWEGFLDWSRKNQPLFLSINTYTGFHWEQNLDSNEIEKGLELLLNSLWEGETQVIAGPSAIDTIGHRVVHGGAEFEKPTLINEEVKQRIRQLILLAPLHNPANLQGIEWMEKFFPCLPQIAVFDTAFHITMPEMIKTYPLPWEWKQRGIQRYGFHGISHQYCAERATAFLNQPAQKLKIINCHLGNGCSLCAIQEGKSYETTMGFTPLEGLMMGSRCGSIDPGILLYLLREEQMSEQSIAEKLNFESGLKGIAGSSDMRDLLGQQHEERAHLAVQMFVHRLQTAIGALAVSLGGFNVLIFTGGIGEHAAAIREETCRGLACLGVAIDLEKNRICRPDVDIAGSSSVIRVLVLHTREEWMIACACLRAS